MNKMNVLKKTLSRHHDEKALQNFIHYETIKSNPKKSVVSHNLVLPCSQPTPLRKRVYSNPHTEAL